MTFDKPIDKIEISGSMDNLNYDKLELPFIFSLDEPTISNGICSISIPVIGSGYLSVSIKVNDNESFGITFEAY